ncbi:hypothetical protein [Streptomyces sp. NPDC048111]|uniref:hypothetical protein n=1 Tax=Streptomyces sp. NPDC048111 TaxID=3365500 RepID=UPI00371582F6
MPRSRAPRRRLPAVLLLVLGVLAVALCGPAASGGSVARGGVPVGVPAGAAGDALGGAAGAAGLEGGRALKAPTAAVDLTALVAPTAPAAPTAPMVLKAPALGAFAGDASAPGCRPGVPHQDSDPAAPVRARAAHDQAPVLEDRLAPVALCGLDAAHRKPPVRGPASAAPGPVELSVLRV